MDTKQAQYLSFGNIPIWAHMGTCDTWLVVYPGTYWDMPIQPVQARPKLLMEHILHISKMEN